MYSSKNKTKTIRNRQGANTKSHHRCRTITEDTLIVVLVRLTMSYTNNYIMSYMQSTFPAVYSLHTGAVVAGDAIRSSGLGWRGQRSSSDQLLGNEKVFKSFHLPEADRQQDGGLHHGPPQHFAVGHLADLPELVLFLLNKVKNIKHWGYTCCLSMETSGRMPSL